jgi:hypothetical protein
MDVKKIMKNIMDRISQMGTNTLSNIPLLCGFLLLAAWMLLYQKTATVSLPNVVLVFLAMVSFGTMGLVFVIRKESYGIFWFKTTGIIAILIGLVTMIFWWGIAIGIITMYLGGGYQ